jgi:ketosteroid isomerase-like protein
VSESELVRVIRAAYDAYSRGEFEAVLELLDPDVEWHPAPSSLDPHPIRGRGDVRDYLAPDFFAHQSAEPLEVIEQGDRVLVVARARARGRESGVAIDQTIFHVWTVSGGRAKRFEAYVDRGEALAALTPPAGSPGSAFAGPPPGVGGWLQSVRISDGS